MTERVAPRALLSGAALLLAFVSVLSLGVGATGVSLAALPRAIAAYLGLDDTPDALRDRLILIDVRLPRLLLGLFVGAALATSGAIMQGLFRNPLADPGLIGVSSGAALAAVAVIALGSTALAPWTAAAGACALPVAAFLGGLATTMVLVFIAASRGSMEIGALLLAGVAIGALTGAATGYLSFVSDERELRDLTLWTLGSLSGASWPKVGASLPFALALLVLAPRLTRALNGFLLGEAEAFHLGVDVEKAKKIAVATTAAAVGASVAAAGIIGFLGIVAPHLARLLAGPDHRVVLPGSAMIGAALLVGADILARMAARPAELPIGVVMALIGAPLFLHLVARRGLAG